MKKKRHITAFYMEILVLITVFMVVILILTKVFALSRQQSARAEILTNSVCLAENMGELLAASDSEEMFFAQLGRNGNVDISTEQGHKVFYAQYDDEMRPAVTGSYKVAIEWIPEERAEGTFVQGIITVYWMEDKEPVYSLETGVFLH